MENQPNTSETNHTDMEILLNARDVANILQISDGQVYRLMQTGEMRHIQFGRSVRVRRSDLEAFIKDHAKPQNRNKPNQCS